MTDGCNVVEKKFFYLCALRKRGRRCYIKLFSKHEERSISTDCAISACAVWAASARGSEVRAVHSGARAECAANASQTYARRGQRAEQPRAGAASQWQGERADAVCQGARCQGVSEALQAGRKAGGLRGRKHLLRAGATRQAATGFRGLQRHLGDGDAAGMEGVEPAGGGKRAAMGRPGQWARGGALELVLQRGCGLRGGARGGAGGLPCAEQRGAFCLHAGGDAAGAGEKAGGDAVGAAGEPRGAAPGGERCARCGAQHG